MRMSSRGNVPNFSLTSIWPGYPQLGCYQYQVGAHAPESWHSVLSLPQILEITTDPWNCKQQHPHMPVCEGVREPWPFWNRYLFFEHACILPFICHRPPIPLGICRFQPLHRALTESSATKQLHATMLFYIQPLFLSIFRAHICDLHDWIPPFSCIPTDHRNFRYYNHTIKLCPKMPPKTKTSNVDLEILKAIQVTMQPVLDAQSSIQASQDAMLEKMDKAMLELASVSTKVDTLEAAVAASSNRIDTVVTSALPAITSHMSTISTALDMRPRKWALIISGLDGPAKEPEQDTRAACLKLAADTLQVQNVAGTRISACHRLSPSAGAGIIIRFTDLSERNKWRANAKHLKGKKHFHFTPSPSNLTSVKNRHSEPTEITWPKHSQEYTCSIF